MGKGAGTLELAEDGFFVGKEVAYKAVTMAFMHGQGRVRAGTQYTWSQYLG